MTSSTETPEDFRECVRFHGHVCPGLAIGYLAAKAAIREFKTGPAEDEELVSIVENDSCAVDAIQVMLGCTFGKGNFLFRDWGKQVYTFMDRRTGKGIRVSLKGELPGRKERHTLKARIDAGTASLEEVAQWEAFRASIVDDLIHGDPETFFTIERISDALPPMARIMDTEKCQLCGEEVVESRLVADHGARVCKGCARG